MTSQDSFRADPALQLLEAPSGASGGDPLHDCLRRADEIIELLEEESMALRNFDNALLMELLTRKEHLFNGLRQRIESLSTGGASGSTHVPDTTRGYLRDRLGRIAHLNEGNRVFIENTLAYYEDFLNCLCPCAYGRGQEGRAERTPVAVRGMAFTKEI